MRLRFLEVWRSIRRSFWFLPSLMVVGAVVLAVGGLVLDSRAATGGDGPLPWFTVAGAESARSLLSTIAGSMITVAGVTFSIVIVALSLASSQFGPRLLTGFMQDTGNQVVLGTFISVFVFCLMVLAHLPGSAGSRDLPQISILTAVVLAVLALGVLIFFFHHISTSIQAGELVRSAGRSLEIRALTSLPAEPLPEGEEEPWPPRGFSEANARISAADSGYLSTFDPDRLADFARVHELRIMAVARVGDFILEGEVLALVTPPEAVTAARGKAIREAFALVQKRGEGEDLPLAVERLTEIAVRGLSPGINDPYTARAALFRLAAGLDRVLERLPASQITCDSQGTPRFFLRPPDAGSLLELAFGPVRTYGCRDVRILETMLDCLARLGREDRHRRWRPLLLNQAERVAEAARIHLEPEDERARIEVCYERAWGELKA